MTDYLQELNDVRLMLSCGYDGLKSGRVKPIDGEEALARLYAEIESRRAQRE